MESGSFFLSLKFIPPKNFIIKYSVMQPNLRNKMSLVNLDTSLDLTAYANLIGIELNWLFKGSALPSQVLFIPDAYNGTNLSQYIQTVRQVFSTLQINVKLISEGDPVQLLSSAACIAVGGGSIEKLLKGVASYKNALKDAIGRKVPFLGWNEGAVLACPGYVVPDPVTGYPDCLASTKFQYFVHFVDNSINRSKMKDFLTRHQGTTPAVSEIYSLVNAPGGTGVRLEDDIIAIDYAGNTPVDPTRKFTLNDLK
jgi:peptidase E